MDEFVMEHPVLATVALLDAGRVRGGDPRDVRLRRAAPAGGDAEGGARGGLLSARQDVHAEGIAGPAGARDGV